MSLNPRVLWWFLVVFFHYWWLLYNFRNFMDKWSQQQELHKSPADVTSVRRWKKDGDGHCRYFQQPWSTLIKISGWGGWDNQWFAFCPRRINRHSLTMHPILYSTFCIGFLFIGRHWFWNQMPSSIKWPALFCTKYIRSCHVRNIHAAAKKAILKFLSDIGDF